MTPGEEKKEETLNAVLRVSGLHLIHRLWLNMWKQAPSLSVR
jgi:hypothetical protein